MSNRPWTYIPYWDKQGRPLDLRRFAELRSDPGYRTVERTRVPGGTVITCWLGTDQGDGLGGPPLIFGTIFHGDDDSWEHEVFSATEADAFVRHQQLVVARNVL